MLKGQAKTDYQRDYMRKRRGSNIPVRPAIKGLTDRLKAIGLTIEGNRIPSKAIKQAFISSEVPVYNPSIHRAGDWVLVSSPYSEKLIEITIPELDGDGNGIPEY